MYVAYPLAAFGGSIRPWEQLDTSKDHVVFVCATLGELDYDNDENWFRLHMMVTIPLAMLTSRLLPTQQTMLCGMS